VIESCYISCINSIVYIKALEKHFDPNNIMNPGGTLALDLEAKNKRVMKVLRKEPLFMQRLKIICFYDIFFVYD